VDTTFEDQTFENQDFTQKNLEKGSYEYCKFSNCDLGFCETVYVDDMKVRKEDPVSVAELTDLRFKVYPNPFQNQLTIESEEAIDGIRLFSINGTLLFETSDKNLDLTHFEKGYYFVQIESGAKIATQKVLKF
jgi:hypothetical protein